MSRAADRRQDRGALAERLLGAVLLIVGATSACSSSCTVIGATSGVGFDVSDVADSVPEGSTMTACVNDRCQTATRERGPIVPTLFVDDPRIVDQAPVRASLTIVDAGGKILFDVVGPVIPEKTQPNGPDCSPTAWQASLRLLSDGTVASG